MAIEKRNVNELREKIKECVGQNVVLRGSLGRNKTLNIEGTLVNAYHDYFQFGRIPMLQTLLSGIRLQTFGSLVSTKGIIQSLC